MSDLTFGITLPNRGINLGICTPEDLLQLAELAEAAAAARAALDARARGELEQHMDALLVLRCAG